MSPAPPSPTPAPPFRGRDERAAPPADGVRRLSRRLVAIGGAVLIVVVVAVVLAAIV
jgi:hypothetical protein